MTLFRLTPDPIVPEELAAPAAGGFVTFDGRVRNHNEGRPVLRLEYEAYGDLAVTEGQKILDEATRMFGLQDARVVHRVGLLEIGECAVWIGVAAAHRGEAFKACAYIIDELKRRVPIWKKEHYEDGPSEWIGVQGAVTETEVYRRQTILEEVGFSGQEKLKAARVLIVGVGGLGSAVLPYLAAAGIGRIGICDGDRVDITNLHRQVIYEVADRGEGKAELAAAFARRLNPLIEVTTHPNAIDARNAAEILEGYDIVVDGTDSFAAKFLLNEWCIREGKILVTASLHRFEGQLLVIDPTSNGGCMRCLWAEAPYDGCVGTCAEEGVLGVVPGVLGVLQANEVLKLVLGMEALRESLALVDLRRVEVQRIARGKRSECPICGSGTALEEIDISYSEALRKGLSFVDIRDLDEEDGPPELSALRIPRSRAHEIEGPVCIVCQHGHRSGALARELRAREVEAYSLLCGLEGFCKTWLKS